MSRSTAATRQFSRTFGNSINFPSGAYFSVSDNAAIKPAKPFSISLWIKTLANSNLVVLEKDQNNGYSVQMDVGGVIKLVTSSGAVRAQVTSNIAINDNKWHHVLFVQGSSVSKCYIDGVDRSSSAFNDGQTYSTGILSVGGRSATLSFIGSLDDIQLYNVELTVTDAINLYYGLVSTATGCVARWKMDEGSGNTVADSIGTNNGDMTGHAGTWSSTDVFTFARSTNGARPALTTPNGAVDLTAANAQVSWGNIQGNTNTVVTAAFLWNPTTNSTSNQETIWGYGNQRWFFIYGNTTTALRFAVTAGSEQATSNVGPLTIGQWYRIIGTYDPAGGANNLTIRVYDLTGALVFSNSTTAVNAMNSSGSALQLGHDPNRNFYQQGKGADCRVWGRILTVTEQDNLAVGITPSSSNLLLWTKFSEGSGSTVADFSGNGQTGTLTNATFTSVNAPATRTAA